MSDERRSRLGDLSEVSTSLLTHVSLVLESRLNCSLSTSRDLSPRIALSSLHGLLCCTVVDRRTRRPDLAVIALRPETIPSVSSSHAPPYHHPAFEYECERGNRSVRAEEEAEAEAEAERLGSSVEYARLGITWDKQRERVTELVWNANGTHLLVSVERRNEDESYCCVRVIDIEFRIAHVATKFSIERIVDVVEEFWHGVPRVRLLRCLFHPLSDDHVAFLCSDAMFRLVDLKLPQEFEMQIALYGEHRQRGYSVQPTDEKIVDMVFLAANRNLDSWTAISVVYMTNRGSLFALCPILPSNLHISEEKYKHLRHVTSRIESLSTHDSIVIEAFFPFMFERYSILSTNESCYSVRPMSSRICSSTYDFSIQSIGPIPLSQKAVPWEYEATQLNIHFTNNREIVLSILSFGGEDVSEEMQQSSLVDRYLESSHPVVLSLCWLCGDLLPSWLDEPSTCEFLVLDQIQPIIEPASRDSSSFSSPWRCIVDTLDSFSCVLWNSNEIIRYHLPILGKIGETVENLDEIPSPRITAQWHQSGIIDCSLLSDPWVGHGCIALSSAPDFFFYFPFFSLCWDDLASSQHTVQGGSESSDETQTDQIINRFKESVLTDIELPVFDTSGVDEECKNAVKASIDLTSLGDALSTFRSCHVNAFEELQCHLDALHSNLQDRQDSLLQKRNTVLEEIGSVLRHFESLKDNCEEAARKIISLQQRADRLFSRLATSSAPISVEERDLLSVAETVLAEVQSMPSDLLSMSSLSIEDSKPPSSPEDERMSRELYLLSWNAKKNLLESMKRILQRKGSYRGEFDGLFEDVAGFRDALASE